MTTTHAEPFNPLEGSPTTEDKPQVSASEITAPPAPGTAAPERAPKGSKSKTCPHCHKRKNVEMFGKNIRSKDGLQSWCKECGAKDSKERADRNKAAGKTRSTPSPKKQTPAAATDRSGWLLQGLLEGHISPDQARSLT